MILFVLQVFYCTDLRRKPTVVFIYVHETNNYKWHTLIHVCWPGTRIWFSNLFQNLSWTTRFYLGLGSHWRLNWGRLYFQVYLAIGNIMCPVAVRLRAPVPFWLLVGGSPSISCHMETFYMALYFIRGSERAITREGLRTNEKFQCNVMCMLSFYFFSRLLEINHKFCP